jgi:group I intron endonuclease
MLIPRSFGLNKCGIYCITNTVNNKQYIGSSKNIYYRLKRHYSELNRKTHANPYLLNSYVKYGKDCFSVEILEEVQELLLREKEQEYIDKMNPAYNITRDVIRNTLSEASRKKISDTLKKQKLLGLLKYPTHDDKKKPVVIYDNKCNYIDSFDSERAAAKKLESLYPGLKHSQSVVNATVNLSNRRKRKRYKQHYLLRPDELCDCTKMFRPKGIKVKVIDIASNTEHVFPTLMEAARVLNCNETTIKRGLMTNKTIMKRYKIMKYEGS